MSSVWINVFFCWWSCGYRVCHQSTGANCSVFSGTASSVWYHQWSCASGPALVWTYINIQIQSLRRHTWDGIQGTCPSWLSKLTWVEWHSMWCIYSQVQESRRPQFVFERSVWAQRGELVQTGNRVLGWKGLWSLCVREQEGAADILAYLSLSLLAFESEWQRLQVSPACLCISVSFKR